MSIEIDRDPFSSHYGHARCTDCGDRTAGAHTCRPRCRTCGERVWGGLDVHKSCCPHPAERLADWSKVEVRLARNGQRNYYLRCAGCGGNAPQKHAQVPDWAKGATPNRDGSDDEHPCARCDNRLTEYHHFAPRAIFADSAYWPGAWLCKSCHQLWHSAIREAAGRALAERRFCDWADDNDRHWDHWRHHIDHPQAEA